MHRLMRSVAPIFLLLLPGLASCQAGAPSRAQETAAAAVRGPQLNPDPKQRVKVHGRLPKHLTIRFVIDYATTSRDPVCQKQLSLGGFGRGLPLARIEALPARHAGDHFETTLVVDKYLSGHCGWRFRTANAIVARRDGRGQDGSSTNVLDGSRYEIDDSVPRCRRRNKACTEDRFWRLSNHDENIPVIARCQVKTGAESVYGEAAPSFQCQDIANDSYKKSHLIRPDTQQVRIDVYDLEFDADPAPVPTRSQDNGK